MPTDRSIVSGRSSDMENKDGDDAVPNVPGFSDNDRFDDDSKVPFMTARTFFMTILVSMGGICFGYDTGQISGFLLMPNFRYQFGDIRQPEPDLTEIRTSLLVALLSIGCLIGALVAGPLANNKSIGRKYSIVIWVAVFCIGNVFQIAAQYPHWYVMLIGRVIAGLAIGGLSVMVPAFQGESAPTHLRGAIVCCYQLFITIGILIAYIVNYGSRNIDGPGQWRLPVGIGFVWAVILGVGILFFPETPRHEFRNGRVGSAARSIASVYGVSERHQIVKKQLEEMQYKLQAETEGGEPSIWEVFTGPKMAYRTLLGVVIQALQQLTGANFFFYYGATIFSAVGVQDEFVTQIILGAVNVVTTFPGLYMVEKYGRRKCLGLGAAWMFICFLIFASLGNFALTQSDGTNDQTVGYVMIVFACLFIAAFASTWGPMAWAVTSEIYPSRYRSVCIAFCAASNWIWNFFIGFATPPIEGQIGFAYGYVFAGCNLAAVFVVFFFLPETSGRSLEEIDTLFLSDVKPWQSSKWIAPEGEEIIAANRRHSLTHRSGSKVSNKDSGRLPQSNTQKLENVERKENDPSLRV